MDEAKRLALNLTQAVLKFKTENEQQQGSHIYALQKLAIILKQATGNSEYNDSPVGQTSSTPTEPKAIRATSKNHVQKTKNNTPGMIPDTLLSKSQSSEGEIPLSYESGLSPDSEVWSRPPVVQHPAIQKGKKNK